MKFLNAVLNGEHRFPLLKKLAPLRIIPGPATDPKCGMYLELRCEGIFGVR